MKYLFAVLVIICSIILGVAAHAKMELVQEQNRKELSCVSTLISHGIARKDIYRSNGTCSYVPNGYFLK